MHSTYRRKRESARAEEQWHKACRRFHEDYDQLAFPGGITEGMRRLATNDPGIIESAVVFLEVDPFFFRSGYIKEDLLERLRWAPLDEDQKQRMRQVILARIRDPKNRREFRRYCRLAPFVADAEFEKEIAGLAGSSGAKPKRAQWVLEHLRQGVPRGRDLSDSARSRARASAPHETACRTGISDPHKLPPLHVNYRYGNFYNCPVKKKGISVAGR